MDIFWNHTFGNAIRPSCLVIADHLSARSLSVTWNVINFACKRGVGRQHTTFTSCQNAAFSNEFCLWRVDYALEGLVLIEQMWFFALISYWEVMTCILIFCGYCFWLAWFSLWYKKVHCGLKSSYNVSQAPEDAMFNFRRPIYKQLFKSNRMPRIDQKSDVNQTCQQSVFLQIGACIRIWCKAAATEGRSQMFVYRGSHPFPSLSSRFFTLSPNREPVHSLPQGWPRVTWTGLKRIRGTVY